MLESSRANSFVTTGSVRLSVIEVVASAVLLATCVPLRGEVKLADVVENVRKNEQLYGDIEIVMQESYDIGTRTPANGQLGGNESNEVFRKNSRTRYVSQGKWFRVERDGASQITGKTLSLDHIRAFDGETTRVFDQSAIGNISKARLEDAKSIRPHMLPSRYMDLPVPLSVFLSGHEAIRAHPNAQWSPNLKMQVAYDGDHEYDGLNCHKIVVTTVTNTGHVSTRTMFWLAEERNYLPIRRFTHTPRFSNDVPTNQTTMSDLRQIKPGIWFPFEVKTTAYNKFTLQREGRQKLQWQERYAVESAELNPKYDREFFSNVEFPDGTAMYELDNGKVVRSWRQGAPKAKGAPTGAVGFQQWWILWVNLAVVLLLAALFIIRKSMVSRLHHQDVVDSTT